MKPMHNRLSKVPTYEEALNNKKITVRQDARDLLVSVMSSSYTDTDKQQMLEIVTDIINEGKAKLI